MQAVVVANSALLFGALTLIWVRVTDPASFARSGAACSGPPGKVACIHVSSPMQAWVILAAILGAALGGVLAALVLRARSSLSSR
jgi:hypothetical protein